jgi:hypothetical protein
VFRKFALVIQFFRNQELNKTYRAKKTATSHRFHFPMTLIKSFAVKRLRKVFEGNERHEQ